jgi:hypothetical protein|uniref:SNARE associated Golgi protein n=1 Tax=viral metagenome TaxID=1070528 RepID=A0A6C0EE82_9ZZZZ
MSINFLAKRENNIILFLMLTFYLNKVLSFIYSLFILSGYLRLPYTYAWFILICSSIFSNNLILLNVAYGSSIGLLISYYGIVYNKKNFIALVDNKKKNIIKYIHNKKLINIINNNYYIIFRLSDIIMHLLPLSYALIKYHKYLEPNKFLLSLPTNIIYFYSTGLNKFNETNIIYHINPNLTNILWLYIYISPIISIIIIYFILII